MISGRWARIGVILLIIFTSTAISDTYCASVDLEAISGNAITAWTPTLWNQTTQGDFEAGIGVDVNTSIAPGDVKLESTVSGYTGMVTDPFDNETRIALKSNLVVSGGQVILASGSGTPETLRPDGAGDETAISSQAPLSGAHWDKVDEETADDLSTYISTTSTSYQRDLYNISDHTGSGTINSVTVYSRYANILNSNYAVTFTDQSSLGQVRTVGIASYGQIADAVTDTLNFDADQGLSPSILPVSGDVYAVAYAGDREDGYIKTVEITANGQITDTVIETLEFDTFNGMAPDLVHVSGNVYAVAYSGKGDDGFLTTVTIPADGQNLAVIESLPFTNKMAISAPNIIPISGNVYAIAYSGESGDGYLTTVEIATDGTITGVIDTLEFDTVMGFYPNIIPISGTVYAIAYAGGTSECGYLRTVEIATDGQINDSVIDTLEFDSSLGTTPNIIPILGDVYAIAYTGPSSHGFLKTVEIAESGMITDTVLDTMEFNDVQGEDPNIIPVSGDVYTIAYNGQYGQITTVEIATDGDISATPIDTENIIASGIATPSIIPLPTTAGDVYARVAVKTHDTVYSGDEESTSGDIFVSASYQWIKNPFTGSDWTWDEIDALQAGVELKTDDSGLTAACTQVYVVVDCSSGYTSPGTLTSTNLLSGETVDSIDNFSYTALAIPSGTALQVQFSQDSTTWYDSSATEGGWDTLSQGTGSIDLATLGWSGSDFYYRLSFTSDGTDTPVLDEISVSYSSGSSSYTSPGTLASQVLDTGIPGARWDALFYDETVPAGTDIAFEVRASDTSFAAGDGNPAWQPEGSGLPAGRYKQWRATLTTTESAATPVLHEVRVWYS
jgi:hypothetical protein